MKKIALLILLGFLLLPVSVFGFSYSRDSGYTFYNAEPVNFTITFDSYEDLENYCGNMPNLVSVNFFQYDAYPPILNYNYSLYETGIILSTSTLSYSFDVIFPDTGYEFGMSLPVAFNSVQFYGWDGASLVCSENLEGETETPVFEVLQGSAPAGGEHLFSLPENMATSVFGFTEETMNSLSQAIYILSGLALGSGVVYFVVGLFGKK